LAVKGEREIKKEDGKERTVKKGTFSTQEEGSRARRKKIKEERENEYKTGCVVFLGIYKMGEGEGEGIKPNGVGLERGVRYSC
jgi:hypothetical protein